MNVAARSYRSNGGTGNLPGWQAALAFAGMLACGCAAAQGAGEDTRRCRTGGISSWARMRLGERWKIELEYLSLSRDSSRAIGRADAVSPAPWGLPPWTACRWGRGPPYARRMTGQTLYVDGGVNIMA
jgi:hypothetical protein